MATKARRDYIGFKAGIDPNLIDTLLENALEGGSTYWVSRVEVLGDWPALAEYASEVVSRGGRLRFFVNDEWDGTVKAFDLDLAGYVAGLVRYGTERYGAIPVAIETDDGRTTGYFDVQDAEQGDMVLQYALFGNLVYG